MRTWSWFSFSLPQWWARFMSRKMKVFVSFLIHHFHWVICVGPIDAFATWHPLPFSIQEHVISIWGAFWQNYFQNPHNICIDYCHWNHYHEWFCFQWLLRLAEEFHLSEILEKVFNERRNICVNLLHRVWIVCQKIAEVAFYRFDWPLSVGCDAEACVCLYLYMYSGVCVCSLCVRETNLFIRIIP